MGDVHPQTNFSRNHNISLRHSANSAVKKGMCMRHYLAITISDTSAAPARRRVRAHSFAVEPVVNTSSTSASRVPAIMSERHTLNAPLIFVARLVTLSCTWGVVLRMRLNTPFGKTGVPYRFPIKCARFRAWLNPRHRVRDQCRGIGTSQSVSASIPVRSAFRHIISASTGARYWRRRYLN